ncbi:MAG: hypothetical protein R3Y26_09820 [Rikenellaceae bacterium]
MKRYKVLWVDDQPTEEFLNEAYDQGLDITVATNHCDGVVELQKPNELWDAIILDVNCKKTANDANESIGSFTETKAYIDANHSGSNLIPWFVYTGGGYDAFSIIKSFIQDDRRWDDRKYYNKPADMNILFENIKRAADNVDTTKIKHKYADVFGIDNDINSRLLRVLQSLEQSDFSNPDILNSIRKILEWLRDRLIDLYIIPSDIRFNEFSKKLGNRNLSDYVPCYIQRSLHSCTEVTQNGSHLLGSDGDIATLKAPYLNRSTIYEMLNILVWYKYLINDREQVETLARKVAANM